MKERHQDLRPRRLARQREHTAMRKAMASVIGATVDRRWCSLVICGAGRLEGERTGARFVACRRCARRCPRRLDLSTRLALSIGSVGGRPMISMTLMPMGKPFRSFVGVVLRRRVLVRVDGGPAVALMGVEAEPVVPQTMQGRHQLEAREPEDARPSRSDPPPVPVPNPTETFRPGTRSRASLAISVTSHVHRAGRGSPASLRRDTVVWIGREGFFQR